MQREINSFCVPCGTINLWEITTHQSVELMISVNVVKQILEAIWMRSNFLMNCRLAV